MIRTSRNMLIIDFSCALIGTGIYFFLYDFMIESLAIPRWMVSTQLFANLIYGLYGVGIHLGKKSESGFFRFLIFMNFAYASFCIGVAVLTTLNAAYGGALVLLLEGIFIAVLAQLEWQSLKFT